MPHKRPLKRAARQRGCIGAVAMENCTVENEQRPSRTAALRRSAWPETRRAIILGESINHVGTEMNRGFDIPKATTASAAQGIYDGLARGEEEIFPDPASQQIAEGWRNGVSKALEREFSAFVPATATEVA